MAEQSIERLFDGRKQEELPSSQRDAKILGIKHFFTGKKCKHGHISARTTSSGTCMECHRQVERKKYSDAPPHVKEAIVRRICERDRQLRIAEPERVRSFAKKRMRAWRAANPIKNQIAAAACRDRNRDSLRRRDREKYAANPEKHQDRNRKWREANPEKVTDQFRRWCRLNPDKVKVRDGLKRFRRRGAHGSHTAEEIANIRKMQKDCCAHPWCRKRLNGSGHKDHIIPIAKGGTNHHHNIQLLCPLCNMKKRDLLPDEYAKKNGYLI
jgi:hypothetical protein